MTIDKVFGDFLDQQSILKEGGSEVVCAKPLKGGRLLNGSSGLIRDIECSLCNEGAGLLYMYFALAWHEQ